LSGLGSTAAAAAPIGHVMPVLDQATATGPIARYVGGSVQQQTLTVALTDTLDATGFRAPRDTVPSQSSFQFTWHAEPLTPGATVVGYRYGLNKTGIASVTVDSSVHSVSLGPLDTGGIWIFSLVAIDAGGGEQQVTRRFMVNFAPDVWFAGPDPTAYPIVPGSGGQRYVDLPSWTPPPAFPASLLSCDSLTLRPAARTPRKTFFEFFGNRVYVRAENDTVDRNSWVILPTGGSDLDSPYLVSLGSSGSALPDTVDCASAGTPWTVRPDGLNGSPIGFRYRCPVALDPSGLLAVPSASSLYPNYDPSSVFYFPNISAYTNLIQSGKAYMVVMPVDGDGLMNPLFASPAGARQLADSVDAGLDTRPASIALRSKIMTFYVNRNPYFVFSDPGFRPKPPEFNGGAVYTYPTRALQLNLVATDPDPFDPGLPIGPGGPTPTSPLSYTVTVHGRNLAGRDTSYTSPANAPSISIDLDAAAPWIVSPDLTLSIRLCDCLACEQAPGSGRCVQYSIPVLAGPAVGTLASLVFAEATPTEARVRWAVSAAGPARVERRSTESGWQSMGELWPDGSGWVTFEDRAVEPGIRYGYRVSIERGGQWAVAGEAWLDVPRAFALALEGVRPNPAVGDLTLAFSLPDGRPVSLEIFDASGRRVWTQRATGAGRHLVGLGNRFAPGVYVVRLAHEGRSLSAKFAVVR
jgi:hypothetical protein